MNNDKTNDVQKKKVKKRHKEIPVNVLYSRTDEGRMEGRSAEGRKKNNRDKVRCN